MDQEWTRSGPGRTHCWFSMKQSSSMHYIASSLGTARCVGGGPGEPSSCVFCGYASQQRERSLVHQDECVVAFQSKHPAASFHYLVIPREHVGTVRDLTKQNIPLLRHMEQVGLQLVHNLGGAGSKATLFGFHVPPYNSVDHLHMHCFVLPFLNPFKGIKYLPNSPWFCTMGQLLTKLDKSSDS